MTTVTDLQKQNKLQFFYNYFNIIDCGIRTGKTYWAVHNLKKFSRDGKLGRILYLVDTNTLKNSILAEYTEVCQDGDEIWKVANRSPQWGEDFAAKIGICCYQSIQAAAVKGKLDFLKEIDCICWDECDSIFDFAAQAFAKAIKTDFGRKDIPNNEILAIIQKYSSKPEYAPLIWLGEWEKIVNAGRIMCIGLSATPERMRSYYQGLINSSNEGKISAMLRQGKDIYFYNLREHIKKLVPLPGQGYWCYSQYIEENQEIVQLANNLGFHAIELHSTNCKEHKMTPEQLRVKNIIETAGMVPIEYDFVVVNKAFERGFNIRDERFRQVIVNSTRKEVQEQVPRMCHEYSRALRAWVPELPQEMLNKWLTVSQCREYVAAMGTKDPDSKKPMTWNSLKEFFPQLGYTVEKKRKTLNGKTQECYYISGEWINAAKPDAAFQLLIPSLFTELVGERI